MTFSDKALPYAQLGIPVFPLEPRDKKPAYGLDWDAECTTDIKKINKWNAINPDYNCGLVATPGGVFFLEFDQGSLEEKAQKLGVRVPETRVHLSGKNGKHWVFLHNDRSREIGNRSAAANGKEWFSMRADTRYVVGPGSIHPETSKEYAILNDALPAEAPDWVLDFVERNTVKPAKPKDTVPVTDNFDFDDLMDFFGISIRFTKDEVWQVCDVCPVAGRLHEQSTLTAFYWDGGGLGFNCFAASCPSNTEGKRGKMAIGEVIAYLNKKNGEPYRGEIWSSDEIDFDDPRFQIEEADLDVVDALTESSKIPEAQISDAPEPKALAQPPAPSSENRMDALVAEIAPPEPLSIPEPSFSSEVMTGLAHWKKPRERMMFILCGASGVRIGEALGIEIDKHISPDFSTLYIRQKTRHCKVEKRLKTPSAERDIDLHSAIAKLLREFVGERRSGFLFTSRKGKPVSSSNVIRRHLHPALQKLKYVNPHNGTYKSWKPRDPSLQEHIPTEQDTLPRRASELLDGTRREFHGRPLRQDQRGRSVPQDVRRTVWFWLRIALSCTECTENRRKN